MKKAFVGLMILTMTGILIPALSTAQETEDRQAIRGLIPEGAERLGYGKWGSYSHLLRGGLYPLPCTPQEWSPRLSSGDDQQRLAVRKSEKARSGT